MGTEESGSTHDRWARLRFSVNGHLLAAPPAHGQLRRAIEDLSKKTWRHPTSGALVTFGASTIERWFHQRFSRTLRRIRELLPDSLFADIDPD